MDDGAEEDDGGDDVESAVVEGSVFECFCKVYFAGVISGVLVCAEGGGEVCALVFSEAVLTFFVCWFFGGC